MEYNFHSPVAMEPEAYAQMVPPGLLGVLLRLAVRYKPAKSRLHVVHSSIATSDKRCTKQELALSFNRVKLQPSSNTERHSPPCRPVSRRACRSLTCNELLETQLGAAPPIKDSRAAISAA